MGHGAHTSIIPARCLTTLFIKSYGDKNSLLNQFLEVLTSFS